MSAVPADIERHAFIQAARADPSGTLVALDIDGTVSAIVPSPAQATVGDELRATLDQISRRYHLWFVSGREADDARRIVGVPTAGYMGAHGLEVLDEDGLRPLVTDKELRPQLAKVAEAVTADVPEVIPYVERKRWGVSFHYRALGSRAELPQRLRRSIEAQLTPDLRLQPGKMVYEVVLALDRDKGTALGWLIDTVRPRQVLAAGDDLTDVAMFRALAERRARTGIDGLCVAVEESETPEQVIAAADATVDGVAGTHRLLLALLGDA